MLILISPAKSLNFETPDAYQELATEPEFINNANELAVHLNKFSTEEIKRLMDISDDLARLNNQRYAMWSLDNDKTLTKTALMAFSGEVFRGMNAAAFTKENMMFAQSHLRILSGLYGLLKPLDRIQAYRLEMGTKLKYSGFMNLYEYWGDLISDAIIRELNNERVLINLASNEYFKAIKPRRIQSKIITPVFKDYHRGELKMITVYAKHARGKMASYIIKNELETPEQLKLFDSDGYEYSDNLSDDKNFVFVR
jgi:uncharacterized protein